MIFGTPIPACSCWVIIPLCVNINLPSKICDIPCPNKVKLLATHQGIQVAEANAASFLLSVFPRLFTTSRWKSQKYVFYQKFHRGHSKKKQQSISKQTAPVELDIDGKLPRLITKDWKTRWGFHRHSRQMPPHEAESSMNPRNGCKNGKESSTNHMESQKRNIDLTFLHDAQLPRMWFLKLKKNMKGRRHEKKQKLLWILWIQCHSASAAGCHTFLLHLDSVDQV